MMEKMDMLDTGIITTQKKIKELVSKFKSKKKKKWERNNIILTSQCENKWKTLQRNFQSEEDHIDRFRSMKRPFPFKR